MPRFTTQHAMNKSKAEAGAISTAGVLLQPKTTAQAQAELAAHMHEGTACGDGRDGM
jgi:hypothetical protein